MNQHITDEFIATQDSSSLAVELWVDWIPSVDGNPSSPVGAKIEGMDLLVFPLNENDVDKKTRRIIGLSIDNISLLGHGLVWRLCGPSGVLAKHIVDIQTN